MWIVHKQDRETKITNVQIQQIRLKRKTKKKGSRAIRDKDKCSFLSIHPVIWMRVPPDHHVLLACEDPCSLCLPSDQQHSHPLVVCAGSSLCESVYFRVCDSHFLCSANEAELHGTAGPPLILNSLSVSLPLSLSLMLHY